ncbi:hypothetical protein GCM10011418_32960 [Sphingobacterium alkalisoli]|nr:hypothetical protein GCM10011418_32960 [Sphingobacterium alkalisoli]
MTDSDKLNYLYSRIRDFEFPECEDPDYQQVVDEIKEGFQIIINGLSAAADQVKIRKNDL